MDPIRGVTVEQFPGLMTWPDPGDIPPGASIVQQNWESLRPGRLTGRKGRRAVGFANGDGSAATNDVIAIHNFTVGVVQYAVMEDAAGNVLAGRNAAIGSGSQGPPVIGSGFNIYHPLYMAQSRFDEEYGVNGVDRGFRWDGYKTGATSDTTTGLDYLGITAPTAAPTLTLTASGGSVTTGSHLCAYRYVEDRPQMSVDLYSSGSPTASVTAGVGDNDYIKWTALTVAPQRRIKYIEFLRATVDELTTLYRTAKIGAQGVITGITSSAGVSYTITSAAHNLAVGATVTISGVSGSGNMATDLNTAALEIVSVTTDTFTINDATASGTYSSGGYWWLDGYLLDGTSDANLILESGANYFRVPITNDDGSLNLYAHDPPPNWTGVVELFQDRALYLAPVKYTTGTAAFTSGSATVAGTGTAWTQAMVGRLIAGAGSSSGTASTKAYRITAVGGATSLTISETSAESGAGTYTIYPDPLEFERVYYSEVDRPESASVLNVVTVQENVRDDDDIVGGIPFSSAFFVLKYRHIYELTFIRQPRIDVNIRLVAWRGACNKRCWDILDGWAYVLDQYGAYRINGSGQVVPISEAIHDYFHNDGTTGIDWSQQEKFFVQADPQKGTVSFYVVLNGDGTTRPKKWLEFNVRTNAWWLGACQQAIGHACRMTIGGKQRVLQASEDEQVYVTEQGLSDVLTTAIASTNTSDPTLSGQAVIEVLQAGINSNDWANAPIAILDGTGYGQIRKIVSNLASAAGVVAVTVDSNWTTTISASSKVLIGAIELVYRTGDVEMQPHERGEKENVRGVRMFFPPTTNAASLRMRTYWDYDTTAGAFPFDWNSGLGIEALDSDIIVNLLSTRSPEATARGWRRWKFTGNVDDDGESQRTFSLEFKAFQGLDQIVIDELSIEGAE